MSTRVLVIDDEKNIRLTLSQTLQMGGMTVDTAVNGEEGLARLHEQDYDVVLLDLQMPGMDGLEVLRHIRQRRPQMPVLLLTAYGSVESAVEAMRRGAVDYIQKPFAPREIRQAVARAVSAGSPSE